MKVFFDGTRHSAVFLLCSFLVVISSCGNGNPSGKITGESGKDTSSFRVLEIGRQIIVTDDSIVEPMAKDVSKAGIKYVELKFKYAYTGHKDDESLTNSFEYINGILGKYGLTVWSIHLPYNSAKYNNPAAIDETSRLLSVAYQSRMIRLMTPVFNQKRTVMHGGCGAASGQDANRSHVSVDKIRKVADSCGTVLCIENLIGSIGKNYTELMTEIGGYEDVKSCIDVGHAYIVTHDPAGFLNLVGSDVGTVHIDDNHGSKDEHLFPGDGNIDFVTVYGALMNIGYDGVFMFEPHSNDYKSADAVLSYKNAIIAPYKSSLH
ncbi:MAG: sugar phosphate isomerase/epimerase [Bacteroidales bacterium]|jgi:sugar phosphate isomerase/epimerase|nr:sugar phosphate isomerase/epimerase [Bacteroidales bacterium]